MTTGMKHLKVRKIDPIKVKLLDSCTSTKEMYSMYYGCGSTAYERGFNQLFCMR